MMIIIRDKKVTHFTIAHHPLTHARTPILKPTFPNPDQPHLSKCLYTGHDILWCEMSFWSPVPDVLSSSFFCSPPHWQSMTQ